MTEREQLIRQAAAALDLLRMHRGEWVTALDLIRAGVADPVRALALVQEVGRSRDAHEIEARTSGMVRRWRLPGPQLALEFSAESSGASGGVLGGAPPSERPLAAENSAAYT